LKTKNDTGGKMATPQIVSELKKSDNFLIEAAKQAKEVVALRTRLADAQRERTQLLAEREDALLEGRDTLPRVRELFLEIESLPAKIDQLTQHIHWIIGQGVERLSADNSQTAARQYMKCRDNLRHALERFREEYISVQADIKTGDELGPSLTDVHNFKLAEIERVLGGVHFPRVTYRLLPLPPIDAELVRRNQVLAALDNWMAGLH
jgi:hypothetical protein